MLIFSVLISQLEETDNHCDSESHEDGPWAIFFYILFQKIKNGTNNNPSSFKYEAF